VVKERALKASRLKVAYKKPVTKAAEWDYSRNVPSISSIASMPLKSAAMSHRMISNQSTFKSVETNSCAVKLQSGHYSNEKENGNCGAKKSKTVHERDSLGSKSSNSTCVISIGNTSRYSSTTLNDSVRLSSVTSTAKRSSCSTSSSIARLSNEISSIARLSNERLSSATLVNECRSIQKSKMISEKRISIPISIPFFANIDDSGFDKDPMMVAEYASDIYTHLRQTEVVDKLIKDRSTICLMRIT
jgi:hypothetical protein